MVQNETNDEVDCNSQSEENSNNDIESGSSVSSNDTEESVTNNVTDDVESVEAEIVIIDAVTCVSDDAESTPETSATIEVDSEDQQEIIASTIIVDEFDPAFEDELGSSLHLPIASIVVDAPPHTVDHGRISGIPDLSERAPVSFAIGEPFVLEAEAVKPLYLRRRAVCVFSVMFFNATLILILLSVRDSKKKGNDPTEPVGPMINATVIDASTETMLRKKQIKSYILEHTETLEEVLDDPTTNQFKALDFLANEDIFYVSLNQELLYVQRYIEILVMLAISGKPHLILPEYVASRTDDDFIDTMHVCK